ncbi:ABC transporter permease [Prosthecomicrobium pneumaticum]|uniref:Simple sugar transport system permease protein n=1 Tax=Prosthecomicrobium pneumaticum TaxID=81895 RepID=A0A7W9FJ69_9HYPH|nr:ABC transporter permease [Prosthecomicrobium pneumaticum]MBB5751271.1 simple sugar transport system permease protein [Prosthecomicrobium pneumaticum]
MRIELVRRAEHSRLMVWASPLLAVAITLVIAVGIFAAMGADPLEALYIFFVEPLTAGWSLQELVVKAIPITLIAIGLSLCYMSNTWNIGAEGQFTAGAILGSLFPIVFPGWTGPLVLPAMLLFGILGGMLYAAIPALLKIRFGANEILTSLMLVYVAQLLLDWIVRGPWRNPDGYGFPESRVFDASAQMPLLVDGGRMHIGLVFVFVAVLVVWFTMGRTLTGFQIRVLGQAPRAGAFAGFSQNRMVLFTFLVSGGLAGLAGIMEVAGPIGQLRPSISPGYGFTAIIVAFLGRLHPVGILIAGFVLALTYLGGEAAQVALGMSDKVMRVFQGLLLFLVLACDTLIYYRVRLVRPVADPLGGAVHGRG